MDKEENKLEKIDSDMSDQELHDLDVFIKNKLPGIVRVNETDIFRWFELYMAGKNYSEIAELTSSTLAHILYIAHKSEWHLKRQEHYSTLAGGLINKIAETKLDSADTMATIITAMNKFFKGKADRFLATGDPTHLEEMDTRMLSQYTKLSESLEKVINPSRGKDDNGGSRGVSIFINSKENTISSGDKEPINITESNAGKILEAMASVKKEEEGGDKEK